MRANRWSSAHLRDEAAFHFPHSHIRNSTDMLQAISNIHRSHRVRRDARTKRRYLVLQDAKQRTYTRQILTISLALPNCGRQPASVHSPGDILHIPSPCYLVHIPSPEIANLNTSRQMRRCDVALTNAMHLLRRAWLSVLSRGP